jgi:AcrR family transcriptional regulator
MSKDNSKLENELEVADISENAEELENELVEDQQVEDEEVLEAKVKEEEDEDDDEEEVEESADEEDDEDEEPEVKEISIPKTKAGVIQAAVDMLKASRKEDAQKIFAKMAKVDEMEDNEKKSISDVDKAIKSAPQKKNELKAKAKVESVDFEEDLDAVIAEEVTLSDGFRGKAGAIFEAVLTSKLAQEMDRLETEYAQNLEEEVSDVKNELVEKVDSYLNYVVSNWMETNEVAVTEGLRTEIAEDFMTSLQSVFKEHYIDVPEGKVDLVDELSASVAELEETLNKTTEDNIKLHESVQTLERAEVVREQSSGLADTEAEKLGTLVEDIEFDNKDNFEMKVKVVKESYFTKSLSESTDELSSVAGTDEAPADVSDVMSRYSQAISKFNK